MVIRGVINSILTSIDGWNTSRYRTTKIVPWRAQRLLENLELNLADTNDPDKFENVVTSTFSADNLAAVRQELSDYFNSGSGNNTSGVKFRYLAALTAILSDDPIAMLTEATIAASMKLSDVSNSLQRAFASIPTCGLNRFQRVATDSKNRLAQEAKSAKNLLIFIEGAVTPQYIECALNLLGNQYCGSAIYMVSRSNEALDILRTHFSKRAKPINVFDLRVDETGIFDDSLLPSLCAARQIASDFVGRIYSLSSSTLQQYLIYFHEPLLQFFEDAFFATLRRVYTASTIVERQSATDVLILSTSHYIAPQITAAIAEKVRGEIYYVNAEANIRTNLLAHKWRNIIATITSKAVSESLKDSKKIPSTLGLRHTKFSSQYGPLAQDFCLHGFASPEAHVELEIQLDQAASHLRTLHNRSQRDGGGVNGDINVKGIRHFGGRPDEVSGDWICIFLRTDDPVTRKGHEAYLKSILMERKVLIVDFATKSIASDDSLLVDLMPRARCCHYIAAQHLYKNRGGFIEGARSEDVLSACIASVIHCVLPNVTGAQAEVILRALFERAYRNTFPRVLSLMKGLIGIFERYNVSCVVCAPSRNPRIRLAVQVSRLFSIPSVEIQVILNGKVAFQSIPSADYIVCLDQWSKRLVRDYFGYPGNRIMVAGSARYDEIASLRAKTIDKEKIIKKTKLPEHLLLQADSSKLILFASQPLGTAEKRRIFEALLKACRSLPVAIIVKLHPREPATNAEIFVKVAQECRYEAPLVVTRDIDVIELVQLADIVVSHSSNVLVEAALLGTRAIALDFSEGEPVVDFDEMGAACRIKSSEELNRVLRELIATPIGLHKIDQKQRDFWMSNPHFSSSRSYSNRLCMFITQVEGTPRD
jgi:hypothetical protein